MVCRLSSFALVATVVLIASHAAAAPTTENVRLQYKRPVACPNEADLRARVSALTAKVSFVSKNDRAPDAALLDIAIAESDGGYVGNLSFHRATTDEATERHVASGSCEHVAQALALIAALAIDPEAGTEAAAVTSVVPAAPPPVADPVVAPEPSPAARTSVISAVDRDRATNQARYQSDVVVGASLATAQAPSALLGVRLGFARTRTTDAVLRPDVAVLLDVASSGMTEADTTQGRFLLIALSARSCPIALRPGTRALEVGLCARARLGTVRASGRELDRPESRGVFWAEGIVEGRLRAGAPSHKGLFAEVSVGLAVHATRPSYYREAPFRSVYEVPWLGLDTGASFGAYLP